jgi:sugar phosphate isomerase/epimerase
MNRRSFIGSSLAAALVAAKPGAATEPPPATAHHVDRSAVAHSIDRVGLQLYTVRDALEKDFAGTLAKVAAIGYKEDEFAGYFGHSPKNIRALLDKNGLTSPSAHVDYATVEMMWPKALAAAHVIGHQYIVCQWIEESKRKDAGGWKRAAELFNRAGEASQKAGIQFAYHNHNFEFRPESSLGGKMPYDFLLAETDPKLVKMEMDLCWINVGGQDPLTYFDRYPGRFPLVHVKDWKGKGGEIDDAKTRMADVGSGEIDWKRIFAQSGKAGIQHYFVEHDEPKSPFDSIRTSYEYLSKLQF